MSFVAVRFDVEAADADVWSDALLEAGALSVDVDDPRAGTADEAAVFDEDVAADPQWWPVSRLAALLAPDADPTSIICEAARRAGRTVPAYERFAIADRDWVRTTQAQFGPIRIDDGLWIVPTWRSPPFPDAMNLTMDPGLAFGTGSHPTTRLCLGWLRERVTPGVSVLDYGCGSGILAIAAARLGAGRVVGTDIDPQAIVASADNARRNGARVAFAAVDRVPPGSFDLVVANILANPLRLLAPVLAARTAPGGRVALAGILSAQADDVRAAYDAAFAIHTWRSADDWVLLEGERRSAR